MAETQFAILRTMRTDELVTKVPRQRNGSLSKVWSMDQRSNVLDLSSYFPTVESILRSRINTEIIEQSWFAPILPQWRCFMSPWCTHWYASMISPLFAQSTPHYLTLRRFNVDSMHFPLNNCRTSSFGSPRSKSFSPWHDGESKLENRRCR